MTDSQPDAKERTIALGETIEAHVRTIPIPTPYTVGSFALGAGLGEVNHRILVDVDTGVLDPNYGTAFLDYMASTWPEHGFKFPTGPVDTVEVLALADVLELVLEAMLTDPGVDVPARDIALNQARAIASIGATDES